MARSTEVVEFFRSAPDGLVGVLADLAAGHDGWVNIQAVVNPEQEDGGPEARRGRAGLFSLVSGRGPNVPVCTWVPGAPTRHGHEPDSLGIQHGAGPHATEQLVEGGVTFPDGWRRLSDHPKRGLVFELPAGSDPAAVLQWLFAASDVLAPAPLPDLWVAAIHRR